MARCCPCNGINAVCKRCSCVRAGRLCVSCHPSNVMNVVTKVQVLLSIRGSLLLRPLICQLRVSAILKIFSLVLTIPLTITTRLTAFVILLGRLFLATSFQMITLLFPMILTKNDA